MKLTCIAVVLFALVTSSCSGDGSSTEGASSPEAVMEKWFDVAIDGDIEALWFLLDPTLRENLTFSEYTACLDEELDEESESMLPEGSVEWEPEAHGFLREEKTDDYRYEMNGRTFIEGTIRTVSSTSDGQEAVVTPVTGVVVERDGRWYVENVIVLIGSDELPCQYRQ